MGRRATSFGNGALGIAPAATSPGDEILSLGCEGRLPSTGPSPTSRDVVTKRQQNDET